MHQKTRYQLSESLIFFLFIFDKSFNSSLCIAKFFIPASWIACNMFWWNFEQMPPGQTIEPAHSSPQSHTDFTLCWTWLVLQFFNHNHIRCLTVEIWNNFTSHQGGMRSFFVWEWWVSEWRLINQLVSCCLPPTPCCSFLASAEEATFLPMTSDIMLLSSASFG